MEGHHHPELPHGRKNFKEYFFEFLMIFLAVTMGFISENFREHFSDSSKEREYITGMVKNLEVDKANLKSTINKNRLQITGIDTLKNIPKDKLAEIKVQDSLYLYATRYLFYANDFKSDDVTLTQLRNAGGYRLIRNEGAADSIEIYEMKVHETAYQEDYFFDNLRKIYDFAGLIFDLNAYQKFQSAPSSTPILITADREKIYNFYNKCFMISVSLKSYNGILKSQLKYTDVLIDYLKKQYDVD